MPKLFLDLDGTIIDARQRVYAVFQFLISQSNLSFDTYWEIKREGVSHAHILKNIVRFTDSEVEEFTKCWMMEIEREKWLNLDLPFPNVIEKLSELRKNYQLILVTARQSEILTIKQLENLKLLHLFSDVLITGQVTSKQKLISEKYLPEEKDYFIGDTGKDIETGKALGIQTVAVLSGFLSKTTLEKYNPDYILPSVIDFIA